MGDWDGDFGGDAGTDGSDFGFGGGNEGDGGGGWGGDATGGAAGDGGGGWGADGDAAGGVAGGWEAGGGGGGGGGDADFGFEGTTETGGKDKGKDKGKGKGKGKDKGTSGNAGDWDTGGETGGTVEWGTTAAASSDGGFGGADTSKSASKSTGKTTGEASGAEKGASTSEQTAEQQKTKEHLRDALKGKTLESILDQWRKELDEQGKNFTEQAVAIQKFDEEIMHNAHLIHQLHAETTALEQAQKDIGRNMQLAQGKHDELENLLKTLEVRVGAEWDKHQQSGQSADEERVKCYDLAKDINNQLVDMQQKLQGIIEKINMTNKPDDEDTPVRQIISVLNSHLEALSEIDHDSSIMQTKLREVQQQMRMRRRPN